MYKLKQLMARCKCGVYLTVNEHRDVYRTAADALEDLERFAVNLAPDVRAKIIEANTLIDLQFFPDTPGGSYKVLHYDLDAALDEALAAVGAA